MVSLSSARDKAKDTSVQTTMTNLHYAFVMCDQGGSKIIFDPLTSVLGDSTGISNGGGNVCTDQTITDVAWPDLSRYGWWYDEITDNITGDTVYKIVVTKNASIGGAGISCDSVSCVTITMP